MMKGLIRRVAKNLSDGGDRLPLLLAPAALLMALSYFNNRPDLFWAVLFLLSLVAIGFVLKRAGYPPDGAE